MHQLYMALLMSVLRTVAICLALSPTTVLLADTSAADAATEAAELSIAGVKNIEKPIDYILSTDRIDLGLSYSALFQGSLPQSKTGGSGELSLTGRLIFIDEKYPSRLLQKIGAVQDGRISLKFRLRHRHAILENSAASLSTQIGSALGTTDGFSSNGFEIPDFYLQNVFFKGRVELRYGQLSTEGRLDSHALRSSKKAFLNRVFSTNPTIAFPRFGAGAIVRWQATDGFDFTYALTQVQASKTGEQVDFNLSSKNLFTGFQAGYIWGTGSNQQHRLQLTTWAADATEEVDPDYGLSAIYELQLSDSNHSIFARYGQSQGIQTDLRKMMAIGYGQTLREKDLIGVAIGAGESSETKENQGVLEVFYRHHSKFGFEVTPDIQIQVGDSIPANYAVIFGLRGLIDF
ncbi:carbohydrate porin [Rubritalea marina]|uniref:carbohydrate porin n=1 Tax=Rubritalea marina TaxID=361055 RepID=UPI0012E9EE99|nr:carbohydrate porin [Rubritalea marina]